jgi:hypothetical protein
MKTATMNGSAQVSTTLIQVRGRRSSLASSTADHEIWSDPAPVTESTMSSSVRCCGPIELTRSPAPTSLVFSAAASE